MSFLVGLHPDLLGAWGSWIVSISGLLLCSNLLLGLIAAWPRRGTWRTALLPIRKGPAAARLYSWHRAVGLWAVLPAFAIAATRSEEHTSELQSLMRISYAVFCLKKKNTTTANRD